jgi:hypothetical protein
MVYSKALELEPNDPEVSIVPLCALFHLIEESQKPLGPVLVHEYMRSLISQIAFNLAAILESSESELSSLLPISTRAAAASLPLLVTHPRLWLRRRVADHPSSASWTKPADLPS